MESERDEWITIEEAAHGLSVSTKTIRRWISSGTLEARRFGPRLIRIRASALEAFGNQIGGNPK